MSKNGRVIKVTTEPGIPVKVVSERAAEIASQGSSDVVLDSGIVSASELRKAFPQLRPVVIDGLLRQGETMNVIGASKAGKSWLIHGLAVSVANGLWWLGREVAAGKVLIVDNELHEETLSDRVEKVAAATIISSEFDSVQQAASTDMIDLMPLRGIGIDADVNGLYRRLASIERGKYRLICVDALYRAIPAGTSESDNAQMMAVYNCLDRIARETGAITQPRATSLARPSPMLAAGLEQSAGQPTRIWSSGRTRILICACLKPSVGRSRRRRQGQSGLTGRCGCSRCPSRS
jgi:hypothetical protein